MASGMHQEVAGDQASNSKRSCVYVSVSGNRGLVGEAHVGDVVGLGCPADQHAGAFVPVCRLYGPAGGF